MVSATRTVRPLHPAETGRLDGMAFTTWLPPAPQPPPEAGIVILHGAGSVQENHYDFARAAVALGLGALCFDQRGHGQSDGPLDDRLVDDIVAMATHLRATLGDPHAPLALRGSSMGGYQAIVAAQPAGARAVIAICPASAQGLRRGLDDGRLSFGADSAAMGRFLDEHPLEPAVASLAMPLLLLHADGDEVVPVQHSRELATLATAPGSRLIVVPGGHHRSIQHDEELQAVSLRFVLAALGLKPGRRSMP